MYQEQGADTFVPGTLSRSLGQDLIGLVCFVVSSHLFDFLPLGLFGHGTCWIPVKGIAASVEWRSRSAVNRLELASAVRDSSAAPAGPDSCTAPAGSDSSTAPAGPDSSTSRTVSRIFPSAKMPRCAHSSSWRSCSASRCNLASLEINLLAYIALKTNLSVRMSCSLMI